MTRPAAPVTDEDIAQLRRDAGQARNPRLALLCGQALHGDEVARERVAKIITDARDADLMAEFLAVREIYERHAGAYRDALDEVTRTRLARDTAFATLTDLRQRQGEPTGDDPLCCQRYGRLHLREHAVPGCRWFEAEASKT